MNSVKNKSLIFLNSLVLLLVFTLNLRAQPSSEFAEYLNDFPAICSQASDQQPMPGHSLRLGYVMASTEGTFFLFPEEKSTGLQRVTVLDNAGIIGQSPEQDSVMLAHQQTPAGSYVVGQIFMGDENTEPVVTCLSTPKLLKTYVPAYFGQNYQWLDQNAFGRWLNAKNWSKWSWKRFIRRNIKEIRTGFRDYYKLNKWRPRTLVNSKRSIGINRPDSDQPSTLPVKKKKRKPASSSRPWQGNRI